jgi:hypothetical protein
MENIVCASLNGERYQFYRSTPPRGGARDFDGASCFSHNRAAMSAGCFAAQEHFTISFVDLKKLSKAKARFVVVLGPLSAIPSRGKFGERLDWR